MLLLGKHTLENTPNEIFTSRTDNFNFIGSSLDDAGQQDQISTGLERNVDFDPTKNTPTNHADSRLDDQKSSGGRDTIVSVVSAAHLQLTISA